ncbi:hypothetical protein [Glutamicibacter mishrai]|uniref:hypothetical protein n=1 Tax=Glutamicibacter mishrai TaxID=1775880 RepID=UPI003F78CC61
MAFTSRVLVNGVERKVVSWSIGRDLQGDLPQGLGGGNGVTQATAQVTWGANKSVQTNHNPWNPSTGWTPKPGDRVQIFVSDGVTEWVQFTGAVDSPSGEILGSHGASLIDDIDRLNSPVNYPALLATMPPLNNSPSSEYFTHRFPGIGAAFYANLAARTSGFYSTPGVVNATALDVPMQGSMMPLVGDVLTVSAGSSTTQPPLTGFTSWGDVVGDVSARFIPKTGQTAGPVQISFMIAPTHNGTARVKANIDGQDFTLQAGVSTITAEVDGVQVASIPRNGAQNIAAVFRESNMALRNDKGDLATATITTGGLGPAVEMVQLTGDATTRIAGLQVERPVTTGAEFRQLDFEPTYSFSFGTSRVFTANALPSAKNIPAIELLQSISDALMTPTWLDEAGNLRTASATALYNGPTVATLTTLDNILGMGWSNDLLMRRSKISAKYLLPVVSQRRRYGVTVFKGESEALQEGDSHEILIEPEDGEDWVMVDPAGNTIGPEGWNSAMVNAGDGNVFGGIYTDGTNEQYANLPSQNKLVSTYTRLDHDSFKYKATAQGLEPGYQVETRTLSPNFTGVTALWLSWWGENLPIIRAKGKISWKEMIKDPVDTGAPGPAYEHDFGAWATGSGVQETNIMSNLIDGIAQIAVAGIPRVDQLTVTPDPRLQLGDRIKLNSEDFLGITLDVVIIGIDSAFSDSYTQSLSVRVLGATTTYTTYEEFNADGGNLTYEQWQDLGPVPETYEEFNDSTQN